MRKWKAGFLLLALFTTGVAEETVRSCECPGGPCSGVFKFRHREPGGIGYRRGYTSADMFYSFNFNSCFYGFVDGRGHIFNDGKWAANLGIGLRFLPDCYDAVFGANLYGDFREAEHGHFYQIGGGLEWLSPCWDFRANGYGILGPSKHTYLTQFDHFAGNQAIFIRKVELGFSGVDLLLGRWLYRGSCFDLHAGLGGYAFFADFRKDVYGGLLRVKTNFWDWVYAEGQVSYDNRFKWQGQGELGLQFSFGPSVERYERCVCDCCDLIAIEERLVEQPQRFEIIVADTHRKKGIATNPVTNQTLRFLFVDNLSGSDGTFESPFSTLEDAIAASSPGDAIYLFAGSGGAYGQQMITTLQDYQLIGGSGAPFEVSTPFGLQNIPQLTKEKPRIETVLILANQNTVSGLQIFGGSLNAIQALLVEGPIIRNNVLTGLAGVNLENITNISIIEGNVISVVGGTALGVSAVNGNVYIRSNYLTVSDLMFEDAAIFGGNYAGELTIENNIIYSTAKGIHLEDPFFGKVFLNNNLIESVGEKVIIGGF